MIFSKSFKNLDFKKSTTFKISMLLLDIVKILSGVANLAFDYGCSNPCSFRDMTFFWIFFQIFTENLDLKNFRKLEIIISVVRLYQVTLRSCEFRSQI